jgi:hypothetical protein
VLLLLATNTVPLDAQIIQRAKELEAVGYGAFDALHLSSAEAGAAEVLLTTDDRFIKRAGRSVGSPRVRVTCRMDTGARSMTPVDQMTDEQFERYALEVLIRELGPDGLDRFLRLNRSGNGDYTRDRLQWQKHLSVAEIVDSLKRPNRQ